MKVPSPTSHPVELSNVIRPDLVSLFNEFDAIMQLWNIPYRSIFERWLVVYPLILAMSSVLLSY
jgi:hypothetical protein